MRDDRPRPFHEDPRLDTAIRTLRELPPDNSLQVDRIVAAARAQRGVEIIPDSFGSPRRKFWWQGIGTAAAAALVFGVGFIAGHKRVVEPRDAGVNNIANSEMSVPSSSILTQTTDDLATEITSEFAPMPQLSANEMSQLAAHGSDAASELIAIPTSFRLKAAQAKHVAIVGDFNAWNPSASPLTRNEKDDSWSGTISLRPGRHTYAFMIDGHIVPDPNAVNVRDPDYDVIVSTIVVKGPEE